MWQPGLCLWTYNIPNILPTSIELLPMPSGRVQDVMGIAEELGDLEMCLEQHGKIVTTELLVA